MLSPLVHREKKAISFPDWFPAFFVFSTKKAGNMSVAYEAYEIDEDVRKNRVEFLKLLGLSTDLVLMKPEHGKRIIQVGEAYRGFPLFCDGLVTREKGLPLVFLPGDCFPLVLVSLNPSNQFLGLFHIGLKGALAGIVKEAVRFIVRKMGAREDEIMAGLGPGIRSCCYRGWPLVKHNLKNLRNWRYVNPFTFSFDLPSLIKEELKEEGVKWFIDLNLCTCCATWEKFVGEPDSDYLFFSHRRSFLTGEREGRFMAIAWLG